ncbi:hypothetical protein IAT38_007451 [Cryptococcus sp. DSM 104549]
MPHPTKDAPTNDTGSSTSNDTPSQAVVQHAARHAAAVTGYTALDSTTRSNLFLRSSSNEGGGSDATGATGGTNGDTNSGGGH